MVTKKIYLISIIILFLVFSLFEYITLSKVKQMWVDNKSELNKQLSDHLDFHQKNIEYKNKGILNYEELVNENFDFNTFENPTYITFNKDADDIHVNIEDQYAEIEKNEFTCLTDGNIYSDKIVFPYKDSNVEVSLYHLRIFKNYYLQFTSNYSKVTSCWIKDEENFDIMHPDFGFVWYVERDSPLYNIVLYKGYKSMNIEARNFKSIENAFISNDYFYLNAMTWGGGVMDSEVIKISFEDLSYVNEDNCASIIPRDSETKTFDNNCYIGIEGVSEGMVLDYGFTRVQYNER